MNNQVQAQSAANKSCRYQGLVELLTATSSAREEARFVATMRDDAFVFVIIDRPMGVVRPSFSFSFTRVVTQTQPHKAAPPRQRLHGFNCMSIQFQHLLCRARHCVDLAVHTLGASSKKRIPSCQDYSRNNAIIRCYYRGFRR